MKITSASRPFILILAVFGVLYLLFHLLFLWMYTNIDGYFYWAIGRYFMTGSYPFISPFLYAKPVTVSPPLYGILVALIGTVPNGDFILHVFHILLMAGTTLLLFTILSSVVSKNLAALISLFFLIFPTNVIYTASMMTELPAQTAMTAYLYLTQKYLTSHKPFILGIMFVLSAIMSLLKYQFIVLFVVTFLFLLWNILTHRTKPQFLIFCGIIGVLIIGTWVTINHAVTGVWGLSDTKKMPFYTNFVWEGKYYPPENHPAVRALRRYVPATADRYAEYWDLQDYILPYAGRNWSAVDELLGNVGIAAIASHPIEYIQNGLQIFIRTHGHRAPWWDNMATFGARDPVQPLYCDALGTIRFCKPVIMTNGSFTLWNAYVRESRNFYNTVVSPVLLFLFLPLLCIVLIAKDRNKRIFALIYMGNLIPISYLAMTESRYLIPYYPLMILISVLGVQSAASYVRTLTQHIRKRA